MRRGADLHAAARHRTATNKTKAGGFFGYNAFIGTLAPDYHWSGDPENIWIGDTPEPFIVNIAVQPANTNIGPTGVNSVLRSKDILPNLNQVIVDPGFSDQRENFNRVLYQGGFDGMKDYRKRCPNPTPSRQDAINSNSRPSPAWC